jgi:acyl carrier protein
MDAVRDFILREFLPGEDPQKLTATTPLMSSGILDSIATLKLVMFIEQAFNVTIEPHESDQEHLNTLEAICGLVESKR